MTGVRAAIEDNAAAWHGVLARQPGAEVHAEWVVTGVPFALCNSVFFPRWSAEEADARIDAILRVGRERGVPQLWWLGERCTPPDLVARLEARGVVVDAEPLPGMALAASSLPPSVEAPAGLRVERVRDEGALQAFGCAFGAGFGIPAEPLASILAAFAEAGLSSDDVQHYVGRVADRPVAAASVIVTGGFGGLYDVATVPGARGRGYGAALSFAALRGAADAGAHTLILHASPHGLPIYERLGFRAVATVRSVETRG